MEKSGKISIIVPVYKVEQYLRKCIDSIINQLYENLEIILIDDGSLDRCPDLCDIYANKDKRIVVVHKTNSGLASSRNAGLDIASGDLISFVDSDDWIDNNMYSEMIHIRRMTGATVICCDGVHTDGNVLFDNCFNCKPTGTVLSGAEVTKEILTDKIGSQVVKGLYEEKCWDGIRFPVGMLYEDIPTTYRAFELAESVAFINEPFYKYRVNPNSISGSPNPLKPYHQFLGFLSHFDHAKTFYPEISGECCTKVAIFGISTLFHGYTDAISELSPYLEEIELFLQENRKEINYRYMPWTRAFALRSYYLSKRLFVTLAGCFYKIGVQKVLGFEVK